MFLQLGGEGGGGKKARSSQMRGKSKCVFVTRGDPNHIPEKTLKRFIASQARKGDQTLTFSVVGSPPNEQGGKRGRYIGSSLVLKMGKKKRGCLKGHFQ